MTVRGSFTKQPSIYGTALGKWRVISTLGLHLANMNRVKQIMLWHEQSQQANTFIAGDLADMIGNGWLIDGYTYWVSVNSPHSESYPDLTEEDMEVFREATGRDMKGNDPTAEECP